MSALNTDFDNEMASDLAEVEIPCEPWDQELWAQLAHPWETVADCAERIIGARLEEGAQKLAENGFSVPSKPHLKVIYP